MLSIKKSFILIEIIILCIIFIAGDSFGDDHKKNLTNDLRIWSNHYRNGDIDIAKTETLKIIEKINHYKELGLKGIDFYFMLSFMYARLYLIEMQKGAPDKAKGFIDKSIEFLTKERTISKAETEEEKNRLIKFVRELDCTHSVKWMDCNMQQDNPDTEQKTSIEGEHGGCP